VARRVIICARSWKAVAWGDDHAPFGARGNIERRGMLRRLRADGGAEFEVGVGVDEVDAVVYATGYRYDYPFLQGTVVESPRGGGGGSSRSSSGERAEEGGGQEEEVNAVSGGLKAAADAAMLSTAGQHVAPLFGHMFFPRLAPTLVFIGVSLFCDGGGGGALAWVWG